MNLQPTEYTAYGARHALDKWHLVDARQGTLGESMPTYHGPLGHSNIDTVWTPRANRPLLRAVDIQQRPDHARVRVSLTGEVTDWKLAGPPRVRYPRSPEDPKWQAFYSDLDTRSRAETPPQSYNSWADWVGAQVDRTMGTYTPNGAAYVHNRRGQLLNRRRRGLKHILSRCKLGHTLVVKPGDIPLADPTDREWAGIFPPVSLPTLAGVLQDECEASEQALSRIKVDCTLNLNAAWRRGSKDFWRNWRGQVDQMGLLQVRDERGALTTSLQETLEVVERRFQALYQRRPSLDTPQMRQDWLPTIKERRPRQGGRLYDQVGKDELLRCIRSMKRGSAPGPNGLSPAILHLLP